MKHRQKGYISILAALVILSLVCIYLLYGTVNEKKAELQEEQTITEQVRNSSISEKVKMKENIKNNIEKQLNDNQKHIDGNQ